MMTKKYWLLTVLLVISFYQIYAQRFNGGLIGGMSTSEISGDRFNGPSKVGLFVGGFGNFYISEKSSIQMELEYIQKGSRKVPDSTDITFYLLRINYIEIPLLYKYDLTKKITFEAGPSIGYLISKYEEVNSEVLTNPFKNWDCQLAVGGYYNLSRHLKFNVRYSNTLFFPVRDGASGTTYWLRKGQYNEVLSFLLHYQF